MTQVDWDNIRRHKWAPGTPPSDWPQDVRPISLEGLSLFGMTPNDGKLYWDGKEVVVRSRFRLRGIELFLAAIATIGALMQGVATFEPWFSKLTGWW